MGEALTRNEMTSVSGGRGSQPVLCFLLSCVLSPVVCLLTGGCKCGGTAGLSCEAA